MAEKGQVTQLKPNDKAVVRMLRTEACAKCRVCMTFTSKEMILEAYNQCGAEVGDWVELELQQDGFFNAVMIMYALICHFVIKKNNYRWENNKKYTPIAARKAAPPTEQELEYQLIANGAGSK